MLAALSHYHVTRGRFSDTCANNVNETIESLEMGLSILINAYNVWWLRSTWRHNVHKSVKRLCTRARPHSSSINLTYGFLRLRGRSSISISKWLHIKCKIGTLSLASLLLAYSSQRLYYRKWSGRAGGIRMLFCKWLLIFLRHFPFYRLA